MKTVETEIAEQATGCRANPRGLGKPFSGPSNKGGWVTPGGDELTREQAQELAETGGIVAFPNAGAGSYREAFKVLGFPKVEAFEKSSSAGDWSFAVCDGEAWFPGFQSNRYPRRGFEYSVNRDWGFETAEECHAFMAQI